MNTFHHPNITPEQRAVAASDVNSANRPWTPRGQLLLREAFEIFGQSRFGDQWTGAEWSAGRGPLPPPPKPPKEPADGSSITVIDADGSERIVEKPVRFYGRGKPDFIPYVEALERYLQNEEELHRRWHERAAAYQRYREACTEFRQVLHEGGFAAVVLDRSGNMEPVPTQIWSGSGALKVLDQGRVSFSAGNSYFPSQVEGIVLVSDASLQAYLTGAIEGANSGDADNAEHLEEGAPAHEKPNPSLADRGGRPAKWDWEGCLIEMSRFVWVEGLPETQADLVRHIQEWFIDRDGDAPSVSEIKKRASRFFREMREAENS